VDECVVNHGGCQYSCENTPGSFVCTCPPGYLLDTDRRHCIGIPHRIVTTYKLTTHHGYRATRGCHRRLCVLSFRSFGGICETATCPVHEMTSARVDQSARCPVRQLAIRKLAYPRVVQLPPITTDPVCRPPVRESTDPNHKPNPTNPNSDSNPNLRNSGPRK